MQDCTEIVVKSAEDVMTVLWQGARYRAISATDMNEHSSRSHTIFTITVEQTPKRGEGDEPGDALTKRAKVRSECTAVCMWWWWWVVVATGVAPTVILARGSLCFSRCM